jgi:hypothetical protein
VPKPPVEGNTLNNNAFNSASARYEQVYAHRNSAVRRLRQQPMLPGVIERKSMCANGPAINSGAASAADHRLAVAAARVAELVSPPVAL